MRMCAGVCFERLLEEENKWLRVAAGNRSVATCIGVKNRSFNFHLHVSLQFSKTTLSFVYTRTSIHIVISYFRAGHQKSTTD